MSDDNDCSGGCDEVGDDWNGGRDEDGHGCGNDGHDDDCHGGEDDQVGDGHRDEEDGHDDGGCDGDGCRGGGQDEVDGQQEFDEQQGVDDQRHDQEHQACDDQRPDVGLQAQVEQDPNQGRHQQEWDPDEGLCVPPQCRGSMDSGDGNGSGHPQCQDGGSQDQPCQQDQYSDEQGGGHRDFGTYSTKGVYSDFIESVRHSPSEHQQGDQEEDRRCELLRLWNEEHDLVYEDRDRWWPTAGESEVNDGRGYRRACNRDMETQRAITNGHDLDEDRLDVVQWLKDARDLDSCVRSKQD